MLLSASNLSLAEVAYRKKPDTTKGVRLKPILCGLEEEDFTVSITSPLV